LLSPKKFVSFYNMFEQRYKTIYNLPNYLSI
jgi:hypothetical protein